MRTKIATENSVGTVVSLVYERDGKLTHREFVCPINGGYVQEWTPQGTRQVCNGLASTGPTLVAGKGELLAVIRREWRVYRRTLRELGA